jgi:hypothetical protein
VTVATTSYGLRFGYSSNSWKAYQIYFPRDPESPPYLFGDNRNRLFTTESFSAAELRHPILAQWSVSFSARASWGWNTTPAPLWSFSHFFITFSRCQEHSGFVRCKLSFCYFLIDARADPAARLLVFGTPPYLRFSLRPLITSRIFSICSTCSC